jgi:hypothetical protein
MAAPTIQLVATKCPTDELSFTNCAVINEKDIDPKRIRYCRDLFFLMNY